MKSTSYQQIEQPTNSAIFIQYYNTVVIRATEYYPFGMQMPGRSFNSSSYRFGYNAGSEKDDEITGVTGSHFTTFFREFDTRIGRPWTPDPVFQPWQSPYSSMDNNPIWFNDPLGNVKTKFKDSKGNLLHETKDNVDASVTVADDKVDDFKKEVNRLKSSTNINGNILTNPMEEKKITVNLASNYMREGQAMWYNKDENGNIKNLSFGGANVYRVNQIGVFGAIGVGPIGTYGEAGIAWDSKGNMNFYTEKGKSKGYDLSAGVTFTGNTSYHSDFSVYDLQGHGGSVNGGIWFLDFGQGGNKLYTNDNLTTPGETYKSNSFGFSYGTNGALTRIVTDTQIYPRK